MMPVELSFDLGSRHISALAWGDESAPTLIAIHGWLDNAESFYKLAPLIKHYRVVAIDLAGHGRSSWRSSDADYPIWGYVEDLRQVHLQLGARPLPLLAHSLGAGIASLYAATWPESVTHLGLIENLGPLVSDPEAFSEQLKTGFEAKQLPLKIATPRARELLIKSRAMGRFPVPMDAAEKLIDRSSTPVEDLLDHRTLHVDYRLKSPSTVRLTEDQVSAALKRIEAPVLLIAGSEGLDLRLTRERAKLVTNIELCVLPGGHHLHLEDEILPEVAKRFNSFYA